MVLIRWDHFYLMIILDKMFFIHNEKSGADAFILCKISKENIFRYWNLEFEFIEQ